MNQVIRIADRQRHAFLRPNLRQPRVADLMQPLHYAAIRATVRPKYIAYRKAMAIDIGPMIRLQFEDATTLLYQVQEILHANGSKNLSAAYAELEHYRALFPSAGSLAATAFIEISAGQSDQFSLLNEVMKDLYVSTGLALSSPEKTSFAMLNGDLDLEERHRQSGVHFLRFVLSTKQIADLKCGRRMQIGSAHNLYSWHVELNEIAIAHQAESLSLFSSLLNQL
jgi:hypothetical protein